MAAKIDRRCAELDSYCPSVSLRCLMTFAQRKLLILSAWVASVSTVGIILALDKPELWLLIACFALGPAAIANWFWEEPAVTLSQLIAKGRSRS